MFTVKAFHFSGEKQMARELLMPVFGTHNNFELAGWALRQTQTPVYDC